jgi:heterodisulfide reductase subunit B
MLTNEEEVLTVIEKIFNSYVREGAECIVTACPLCHLNLEMARTRLGKRISVDKRLPIIYFTQLVGLSFGIGIDELGISKNIAEHLIEKMVLTATV